ncbi:hypothetical protein [Bosea sp. (in: a-proteobacteria)]|uniref:hypothetical protein n=1 Tax=Bosea sp. (in: a-proteobacteria) TaxID=1871050 RepID=UPI002FCC5AA6
MTQAQQALDYDRSGRFPIDEDGWQVVDLWQDLYPGGPWALRVHAPEYPTFHAGWRFTGGDGTRRDDRVVISHIGAWLATSNLPSVNFNPAMLERVRARLRVYAMEHAVSLFGRPITGIDFVARDPQVENL